MQQVVGEEELSSYIILKSRIKSEESKIYALLMIFFREKNKTAEKSVIIASNNSELFDQPISANWDELEDYISQMKWNGRQNTSLTNDLKDYLESSLSRGGQERMFSMFKDRNDEHLKEEISRIFYRPISDSSPTIEIRTERVSAEVYQERLGARRLVQKEEAKKRASANSFTFINAAIPENSVVMEASFVLSPFKGIPIYSLNVGDRVLVRLKEKDSGAQAFLQKYNIKSAEVASDGETEKSNDTTPSIPAEIYQVNTNEYSEFVALVHIAGNYFARIFESERVNVRKYEGELLGDSMVNGGKANTRTFSTYESDADSTPHRDRFFIMLVILSIVSLGILIFLVLQLDLI